MQLLDVLPWDPREIGRSEANRRWIHRQPQIESSQRSAIQELTRARLAMTLASSSEQIIAPVIRSTSRLFPLSAGSASWSLSALLNTTSPFGECVLDHDSVSRIQNAAAAVANWPRSLWLGARRLISAVSERFDPTDAFVDAVICWENFVGTGDGEVTFRVCGAMAILLEPDDVAGRAALFDELRTLYRVRSGLVHGDREPSPAEALGQRDRAVRLAIKAIGAVAREDRLREAKDSNSRSRILFLGL